MTSMNAILAAAFVLGSAATVNAAPSTSAVSVVRPAVVAAVLPLRGMTDEAAPSVLPSLQLLARGGASGTGGGGHGGHGGDNGVGHGGATGGHDGGHDGQGHDGGHDGQGHGHGDDGVGHTSLPSLQQFARGGETGHGGHGEGGGHG